MAARRATRPGTVQFFVGVSFDMFNGSLPATPNTAFTISSMTIRNAAAHGGNGGSGYLSGGGGAGLGGAIFVNNGLSNGHGHGGAAAWFSSCCRCPRHERYWLLIELGDTEICKTYPGLDEDLYITADAEAFVKWHAGQLTWAQATRDGRIRLDGSPSLVIGFPTGTAAACLPTSGRSPAPPRAPRLTFDKRPPAPIRNTISAVESAGTARSRMNRTHSSRRASGAIRCRSSGSHGSRYRRRWAWFRRTRDAHSGQVNVEVVSMA